MLIRHRAVAAFLGVLLVTGSSTGCDRLSSCIDLALTPRDVVVADLEAPTLLQVTASERDTGMPAHGVGVSFLLGSSQPDVTTDYLTASVATDAKGDAGLRVVLATNYDVLTQSEVLDRWTAEVRVLDTKVGDKVYCYAKASARLTLPEPSFR